MSPRRDRMLARVRQLITAIGEGDDSMVEDAVLNLSRSRRYLAPLAFLVGAFAMLFEGVKLLVSNWRLTLIQILPAMWIWLAMVDLKVHLLHGRSFHVLRGPILIPIILAIGAVTAACFYLNAVFAFAVANSKQPEIRRGFVQARSHLRTILAWGFSIGLCLGVATTVFPRWGRWWFAISLSIVVGAMMLTYVAVPSRIVGVQKSELSTRDRFSAAAVGGAIGAVICAPPYALGRIGVLMLGSHALFVPGLILLTLGVTLQAGATGAVKAIKMSAKLVAGRGPAPQGAPVNDPQGQNEAGS